MEPVMRVIPSYPLYFATETGQIIGKKGNPLIPWIDKGGYYRARIRIDGRTKYRRISRLVCETYNGKPPTPKHEAAHRNGDKSDNRPANLAWTTRRENEEDKKKQGTFKSGERHPQAKLTREAVNEIREIYSQGRVRHGIRTALAERFGVTVTTVKNVAYGRSWLGGDGT